jgi:large subunit ribosomal protein L30
VGQGALTVPSATRLLAVKVVDGPIIAAAETMVAVEEADVAEANVISKQPTEGATLRITWVRSSIGYAKDQKATIQAIGLHRLNETIERPDSATLRGQLFKVKHLLKIEEV